MTSLLITGIGELVTCDAAVGDPSVAPAGWSVVVSDGVIGWLGPASRAPAADREIDLGGRALLPAFVDSHTHLVFAGDRSSEFTARMGGQPYDGGGISATVAATSAASEEDLATLVAARVAEMRAQGTATVEIKSGYGLDPEAEARLLRVARRFTDETTFLGAHVLPPAFASDRAGYVDLVTGPMLDAASPWARWIDVFCEPASPHAFDADEARAVLLAGRAAGLGLRMHGNQLSLGPGVRLGVELGAASVDHCTYLSEADVAALADGEAVATLLPGVEFSTRSPYPDARRLLDAGAVVALATDCNPGTCFTTSMPFVIALAVREMGLTPGEAVWAATAGSARSLRRTDVGRVAVGCRATLAVLDAPAHSYLAYRPGVPLARVLSVS